MDNDTPRPDPGNSAPETWTEPLTEQEDAEVRELLAARRAEREEERRARAPEATP